MYTKVLPIEDGWVVRNNPDGSQTRARLVRYAYASEPERGPGIWNEGITLYTESGDLDFHEGLDYVLDRTESARNLRDQGKTVVYRRESDIMPEWGILDNGLLNIPREEFVSRYLRAFHDVDYVEKYTHTGYSQGDRRDIWVVAEGVMGEGDAKVIAQETVQEWSAWASGDVYLIEVETRTLLEAMDGEEWTFDCNVGCAYGDSQARDMMAEALDVDLDVVPESIDLPIEY